MCIKKEEEKHETEEGTRGGKGGRRLTGTGASEHILLPVCLCLLQSVAGNLGVFERETVEEAWKLDTKRGDD